MRVTLSSSSDIQRTEVASLRNGEAQRKEPSQGFTLLLYLANLTPKTGTPTPSMDQACILTPLSVVVFSNSTTTSAPFVSLTVSIVRPSPSPLSCPPLT